MGFAEEVIKIREGMGITQCQLASMMHVGRNQISQIESKSRPPSILIVTKLVEMLIEMGKDTASVIGAFIQEVLPNSGYEIKGNMVSIQCGSWVQIAFDSVGTVKTSRPDIQRLVYKLSKDKALRRAVEVLLEDERFLLELTGGTRIRSLLKKVSKLDPAKMLLLDRFMEAL